MPSDPIDPWFTYEAMCRYGGGFTRALAECWIHADSSNKAKIRHTWPDLWAEYTQLALRDHERKPTT